MAATPPRSPSDRAGDSTSPATTLEIRLLGGFEVSLGGEPVSGFESQNVRALMAYLACHRGRELPRAQLASLLWSDQDEPTALRNLRQALYNLRTALVKAGCEDSPIRTTHRSLRLTPRAINLDLASFTELLSLGRSAGSIDANHLARAAQIYAGDFLAGFYLNDSPDFEEWMVGEQERLREEAVAALRDLVNHHTQAGSYPLGLQYARQLLRIEPFSEETHRHLIYLYALSGRRSRALSHYEEMRRLFERELGVEPLADTQKMIDQIQSQTLLPPTDAKKAEATGPWVPLVARDDAVKLLRAAWAGVLRGAGRLTLIEGELGVGKTRLVRTFLHEATSERRSTVLQGRSYQMPPPTAFQPLAEALSNAVANDVDVAERLLAAAGSHHLAALLPLVPELGELDPKLAALHRRQPHRGKQSLFAAVSKILSVLSSPPKGQFRPQPLILFLDDLHWADPASFELLEALLPLLPGRPIWIVVAYRADEFTQKDRLSHLRKAAATLSSGSRIVLERLPSEAIHELASSLVAEQQAGRLAQQLMESSNGLPLATVEHINLLWDLGFLELQPTGQWSLSGSPEELAALDAEDTEATILRRVEMLPTSTRRLLTLAAVIGQKFEAQLLQLAEREHDVVVETGLEVMIDHWMVRQFARYWADTRLGRDLALWAPGGRKGTFEFIHKSIRTAVYENLHPGRARALHEQVAVAMETVHAANPERFSEAIAFHYQRARNWRKAIEFHELSARKAERVFAFDTACAFHARALTALSSLEKNGGGDCELRTRLEETSQRLSAVKNQ